MLNLKIKYKNYNRTNSMQYKKYALFFLFIFLACIFCTCKKYPEGPFISLKTKENRVDGTWEVEKYLVNGVDSVASKYSPGCTINFYAKASSGGSRNISIQCEKSSGYWSFRDRKESIVVWPLDTTIKSSLFLSRFTTWKILKLKYKEIHLKTEFNSTQYEIYLKRFSR